MASASLGEVAKTPSCAVPCAYQKKKKRKKNANFDVIDDENAISSLNVLPCQLKTAFYCLLWYTDGYHGCRGRCSSAFSCHQTLYELVWLDWFLSTVRLIV